ncbi:MAG TPA: BrnT family toxin [Thermodesulfobacteriota bacterium]|nr:BrnT family toxin [Thermodesulfobacteriota bacterium]
MRIKGFEWDDGNVLHIELGHGIKPEEAEEVFAIKPPFRKTKRAHYVAMGPTLDGRYLTVVFELKEHNVARVITGWDMSQAEKAYWRKHKSK